MLSVQDGPAAGIKGEKEANLLGRLCLSRTKPLRLACLLLLRKLHRFVRAALVCWRYRAGSPRTQIAPKPVRQLLLH